MIFAALVGLIAIAAIPYGTVEPWWKAAFVCAVFAICIIAIGESLVSGADRIEGRSVLLPMLALSVLAFAQTISLGSNDVWEDRKSTRLNSSHLVISYAVFCLKKKKIGQFKFKDKGPKAN